LARRGRGLAAALSALLLAAVGCGEDRGAAAGATVTAYVAAPLCADARRELAEQGARAGEVRARVACLAPSADGEIDLATVGANARRATEDSTTVAFVELPAATSFSRPIVEAANIAVIRSDSGAVAIERLLAALREGDSGSPRDAVREALG
jgi:hypothetical protein